MGQSSMAVQVAPLPHVHQRDQAGPMHGMDSERARRQSYPVQNGVRNGAARPVAPISPVSSSAGSPNSHNSHASDATHFGKDAVHYDTYDVAREGAESNDTQQTDHTMINESERSNNPSELSGSDNQSGGSSTSTEPEALGHSTLLGVSDSTQRYENPRQPSSIETVSTATGRRPETEAADLATNRELPQAHRPVQPSSNVQNNARSSARDSESDKISDVDPEAARPDTEFGLQKEDNGAQNEAHTLPQDGTQLHAAGVRTASGDGVTFPEAQVNPVDASAAPVAGSEQARSKPRVHSKSNQASASRAAVAAAEMNDDVLVGTRVTEGHENFVTAYNMLTGIRVAVSRCTAKMNRPLTEADFSATDEISFDLNGAGYNPSSKYMFRFKDYAPWVFRHLRDAFRLDPADYLMSLTAKYIVSELGSPGKSGSFFYYSRDYRFIIKTIRHSEHKLLRRILSQYYQHVKKYPDTLISQFYGLHRVRLPFGRKIHFVVMNNVFPALYEIHERYDLKGSLLGREYNPNLTKPIVVYKDLDWLRRHRRIVLGQQKRERLVKQLEIDARFLERVNVMDYSLLVGIHDMSKGNTALNMLLRLKEFGPQGDQTTKKEQRQASEAIHGNKSSYVPPHNVQHEFQELQTLLRKANPEQLKEFDFADEYRSASYFYRDHGGFQSTNDANEEQDVIYYVGIIDFLTGYTFRKSVETFCKGLVHDRRELSSVPAQEYGERFLKFLRGCIGPEIKSMKPNKRNTDQSTNTTRSNAKAAAPGAALGGGDTAAPQAPSSPQTPGVRRQRTMVVSPKGSPRGSPQPSAPESRAAASHGGAEPLGHTSFATANTTVSASSLKTPQKTTQNGAAVTPQQDSTMSFADGPSTPGVAVTSDMSPSVTSRKPSPSASNGRRPSIVGYGPHATGKEG